MSCHYAFCDARPEVTVQGIGGFCDDHADEARKIARLRDHGAKASIGGPKKSDSGRPGPDPTRLKLGGVWEEA